MVLLLLSTRITQSFNNTSSGTMNLSQLVRCALLALLLAAVASGSAGRASASQPAAAVSRNARLLAQESTERCYLGCFGDSYEGRALRKYFYHQDFEMTIENCQQAAKSINYTLFSLQNARECWGSRYIDKATVYGNSENCNQTCTGNPSEMCGGWLAFDLYSVGPCPQPRFQSSATTYPPSHTGTPALVTVSIKNSGGPVSGAIVDMEIYDSTGRRFNQQYVPDQDFATGATSAYNFTWTATSAGNYTVKVGIFNGDWTSLYHWNDAAAVLVVTAACKVRCQFNSYWSETQWQTTFMNIYVTNNGPSLISNPWNFTLFNPTYSGQFLAWNLQRSTFDVPSHTYSGTSEAWVGDLPAGGPEVYMLGFNVISSSNYDFLPKVFTINGNPCDIVRSP